MGRVACTELHPDSKVLIAEQSDSMITLDGAEITNILEAILHDTGFSFLRFV